MARSTSEDLMDDQPSAEIRQALIIHLSDLHFGSRHAFRPEVGPDGNAISQAGTRDFADLLCSDLDGEDPGCPVVLVITGDITSKHEQEGFTQAETFFSTLKKRPILGRVRDLKAVHLVPGNHDIDFTKSENTLRWHRWCQFLKAAGFPTFDPANPLASLALDIDETAKLAVLKLNSVIDVQQGTADEHRGQLAFDQLDAVEALLKQYSQKLSKCLRIALLHHHPILIPQLAEPKKQYDAVVHAGHLLQILQRHGFHLVAHGHKHWPCTFSFDVSNGYDGAHVRPIAISAGGSAGSSELPRHYDMNCYHRIWLKWNPGNEEVRIRCETRGLSRHDSSNQPLLPSQWHWETIKADDRSFYHKERLPSVTTAKYHAASVPMMHSQLNAIRTQEYQRLRGNMLVVETRLSFWTGQHYEAVFWLAAHPYKYKRILPKRVIWSAGPKFPTIVVEAEDDTRFAGKFAYWGPFLLQAMIEFENGTKEYAHIYVRVPSDADHATD